MHRLHCEHIHTHIHTILSYHPVCIQLLLVSAAHKTGGFSFVLIRASKERSCPDGSVHQLFSLVPLPQLVWLEPLSLCALNLVHMNDVREEACDSSNPDRSRKTRSLKEITRIRGHVSDSTNPFLFITLTFCCYETPEWIALTTYTGHL